MRRSIFLVHLFAGCIAGLVILFLSVTGCMLTYERQIVAWQERNFRSIGNPELPRPTLDTLIATAAEHKQQRPTSLAVFSKSEAPVVVEFEKKDRLLLDRYSGAVLGEGAVRTRRFFETMRSLHRYFGTSGANKKTAKAVKGAFNLSLFVMIVTGVLLWMPKKWNGTRLKQNALLRPGLKGKAWNWNRHNVVGIWVAVPLLIIVLTGAAMSYEWVTSLIFWATRSPLSSHAPNEKAVAKGRHKAGSEHRASVSIDQVFLKAEKRTAGWHSLQADLPRPDQMSMTVAVDRSEGNRPDLKSELKFDRVSGEIVNVQTFAASSRGAKIRSMMHMVHTGEVAGLGGQTMSGLASIGCCVLVWTGLSLAYSRFRQWRRSKLPHESVSRSFAKSRATAAGEVSGAGILS